MKIPVMTFMLFIISVGSFSQTKWDSLKTPPHKDIQQMVNINDDIYAVTGKGYILWYKISENEWIQKAKLPVTGYIRMVYYSESLYLFCENGQVYNYKIETDLLTQLNSEKFIEKYFPMMLRAGYSEKYIPLIINDSIYICTGMQDNSDGMRYIYDDSIYVVKYNNDGKPGNEILIEKQRQEYIQALSDGKYLYIVGHKNMVSQYLSITVYSLPDFKEIKEMAGPLRLTGKTVDGAIKFALSDGKFYASRSAELMHYSESLEIWSNIISYPQLISSTIAMTVNNGIIYAAFYNGSFKSYKVATRPSPFSFEDPNICLLPSNSKYLMLTGQAIADVDNNGYKDIVSLYHLEGICIDLYKNTGGKFSTAVCLYENNEFVFGQNCNVKIGDMNNDGHDDIVLGVGDYTSSDSDEQPNVPEIFIGDGKGNFTPRNIEGLHIPVEFSLADINNDGVLEIISPGNGGSVVRLDPDLKSFRKQLCNIPFSSGTLKTCDLNNDGFTDALLMRSLNNPVLAYSIGNGIFRAEAKTLNDSYTKALIADFNNDNVLDGLLSSSYDPPVTDYNPSRLILSVSSDISTGGLFKTVKNIYTPTGEVEAAAAADLDFDGLIDIVGAFGGFFLNTAVESSALLFRNTGSDNYMAVDKLSFNPDFGKEIWYNIPLKMDICDLNNDRKPDLIFGAYSGIPQTNQRLNKILFNGEKGVDINISEKPSGLLATSAGDDVKLTWNHIKQPFYTYEIRLEKKDGSAWVARRGNASDILKINSAWFYSLKPGRYGASIRVLSNSFNNSEWSDEYEFYITETDQIKPNPVTFMRAASYLPYHSLKKTLAGNSGSGVKLNWRIPDNPDFQGVTIVRRNDRYPLSPQDGRIVYNGLDETYLDTSGIAADMRYYYTAFAYDENNNYSSATESSRTVLAPQLSNPPEIVHKPSGCYAAGSSVLIKAEIRDDISQPSAALYYREKTSGAQFKSVPMKISNRIDFQAEIVPENNCQIEYYIEACDGQSTVTFPDSGKYYTLSQKCNSVVTGCVYDIMEMKSKRDFVILFTSSGINTVYAVPDSNGSYFAELLPSRSYNVCCYKDSSFYIYEKELVVKTGTNYLDIPLISAFTDPLSGHDFLDGLSRLDNGKVTRYNFPVKVFVPTFDTNSWGIKSPRDTVIKALKAWQEKAKLKNAFTLIYDFSSSIDILTELIDESAANGWASIGIPGITSIMNFNSGTVAHEYGHLFGLGHAYDWNGGSVMGNSPDGNVTDLDGKILNLKYRLPVVNSNPEITPYSKVHTGKIKSINVLDMSGIPADSLHLGSSYIITASGDISGSGRRNTINVKILNKTAGGSITVPLIETGIGTGIYRGPLFLDSANTGSPLKIKAAKWDELLISADFTPDFRIMVGSRTVFVQAGNKETFVFTLNQNFPNPFNPATTISYSIPMEAKVELKVFDILGREVAILVNEMQSAGVYQVQFNGSSLPSGVYVYSLKAGDFCDSKKLSLIK